MNKAILSFKTMAEAISKASLFAYSSIAIPCLYQKECLNAEWYQ
jgi:hypothetical protein